MVSQVWQAIMHISEGDAPSPSMTSAQASEAGLCRLAVSSTLKRRSNRSTMPPWASWRPEMAAVLSVSVYRHIGIRGHGSEPIGEFLTIGRSDLDPARFCQLVEDRAAYVREWHIDVRDGQGLRIGDELPEP